MLNGWSADIGHHTLDPGYTRDGRHYHPAEAAMGQLKKAGFDMTKLSIVGKDYHTEENVVGYYNARDRIKYGGFDGR